MGKIPWRRDRLPTSVFLDFPGGSDRVESACNLGYLGSVAELGRSPGGGHGYTPVFLPKESPWTEEPGRLHSRSLAGYSPWGQKELEYLTQRLGSNPDSPIYNICIVISLNPYLLSSKMQRMLLITFPQIVVLNEILNVSVF